MSLPICVYIFFLGLFGVLARVLYYAGLQDTSPTFATAISNLIPSATFVFALVCRMEKLDIFKRSGLAKITGTIVSFGGATIMTLYKGITVISVHYDHHRHGSSKGVMYRNLARGCAILLVQILSISAFFILQTIAIKKYPAPLTLTMLLTLVGTLIAVVAAVIIDRRAISWRLTWDITLLGPIYTGVVLFGISTYVMALVVRKRDPVFMTAFQPLALLFVAVMSLFVFGEALHLGGVLGAVVIIIGLYIILWGKEDEKRQKMTL